jgi:hypothetical protein
MNRQPRVGDVYYKTFRDGFHKFRILEIANGIAKIQWIEYPPRRDGRYLDLNLRPGVMDGYRIGGFNNYILDEASTVKQILSLYEE